MKIIRTEQDIEDLEFGEAFEVEIPNFAEFANSETGPLDLLDSDEYKLSQKLEALIEVKFSTPEIKPEPEPEPTRDTVAVSFTDTHVVIESTIDQAVDIGGDVRDDTVKIEAGKSIKRKLTDEGNGYVEVNGEKYKTP